MTFTVSAEMTATEFKNKHGGWPLGLRNGSSAPLNSLTGQFTRGIQQIYPAMSITAIYKTDTMIFFVLHGASSLQYEQLTKRTGEALMTFYSGFKIFNFVKPHDYILPKLDFKMSPPAYTEKTQEQQHHQEQPHKEQPQQEAKDAVASAWKEIEQARKQIEEERKQIEEEKIKMKLRAKMSLFDEEVAKFKQQFFTQEELVSIRKTFDPLY